MNVRFRHLLMVLLAGIALVGSLWSDAHAADYAIRVRVQSQSVENGLSVRKPVAGVKVTVSDASGAEVGTGTTAEDGTATVPVPAPASYKVVVDESTLPDGASLAANTPAEASIDESRFCHPAYVTPS